MPRIGVSITKQVAFRDSVQEFSNVYYFEVLNLPNVSQADTFIDNLTTLEKTFHAASVSFKHGRVWSQIGSAAQNQMISQKTLSGNGARTNDSFVDRERAFLFRLRAGTDSRGNAVYLRKWYHSCGEFVSGQGILTGIYGNTSGWSQAQRDAQVAAMNAIGDANGSPQTPKLCSKGGRLPDAGATWSAHKYLEHHQLGDQWRAT